MPRPTTTRLIPIAFVLAAAVSTAQPSSPLAAVDELLATDMSFSDASASRDLVAGISAMFASDVIVPAPGTGFVEGRDAAVAALRGDPLNATSRATWAPVRGGISADGRHGFTFGFMTVTRDDDSQLPLKYLSYWVRGAEGWRVAVYRRGRRPEGEVSLRRLAPALPPALVAATADAAAVDSHRTSLAQAESAFSAEAQVIGAGPAFAKWGSADAMNMGGPANPGFLIGSDVIGKQIGQDHPAVPAVINWSSERVIVASSGDLGVSLGFIRQNEPPGAASAAAPPPQPGIPFVTIWRRASPGAPWRYVAE